MCSLVQDCVFTRSLEFRFGVLRNDRANPGSEFRFGKRIWPNLDSELGESNGPNPGLAGSEFRERNGPNPDSEFREKTGLNPFYRFSKIT